MEKQKTSFPENLKLLIKKEGITLENLAERIGVTKQAVSGYCTGKFSPTLSSLAKIAEIFNVSTDYLISGVRHENKIVAEELGLSEKALDFLKNQDNVFALNLLLSDKSFYSFFSESINTLIAYKLFFVTKSEDIEEAKEYKLDLLKSAVREPAQNMLNYFLRFFNELFRYIPIAPTTE